MRQRIWRCVPLLLVLFHHAPALAQTCRWDGTAPWCDGECSDDEQEITRLDGLPEHWVPPIVVTTPPFGENCLFGSKALCCKTGIACRWDGTAPFCDGECDANETSGTPPPGSNSGSACWTGDKAYCCHKVSVTNPLTTAPDADQDGVVDTSDNCPSRTNPDQLDSDHDTRGNACDTCPNLASAEQADPDQDSLGNPCDNCPDVANQAQADADHDARGDACDNCPALSNPDQQDTDSDQSGDACDADDDNDGCSDEEDQHPADWQTKVGTITPGPLCPSEASGDALAHEGLDTDHDGAPNCKDADDDNDRIPDDADPCPTIAGASCVFVRDCPAQVPWDVCSGGNCAEWQSKFSWVINPPSAQPGVPIATFERFWIEGGAIYIVPNAAEHVSVANLLHQLSTAPSGAAAGKFKLEISPRQPGRERRAAAITYDPGHVVLAGGIDVTKAASVRLTPSRRRSGYVILEPSDQAAPR
jgi:hypothetical protein